MPRHPETSIHPRRPALPHAALAFFLAVAIALALTMAPAPSAAGPALYSSRTGATGMSESEPHTGSLLVDYYETFLRDHDIERFRLNVLTRYTEGTLARLVESTSTQARRAAVLALGLAGGFEINSSVARALRDSDQTVRELASSALWSIWFRADTPENNQTLEQVSNLIGRHRPEQAVALATRLLERAPMFAEAYNQRAIAQFAQEHYEESAADCRRALKLNPYHFGALGGLAQCQLQLGQRREALKTFRRALRLQPYSHGLRELVDSLEAEGE